MLSEVQHRREGRIPLPAPGKTRISAPGTGTGYIPIKIPAMPRFKCVNAIILYFNYIVVSLLKGILRKDFPDISEFSVRGCWNYGRVGKDPGMGQEFCLLLDWLQQRGILREFCGSDKASALV